LLHLTKIQSREAICILGNVLSKIEDVVIKALILSFYQAKYLYWLRISFTACFNFCDDYLSKNSFKIFGIFVFLSHFDFLLFLGSY